jgi:uncharacterized protein YbjQ (UPF0145 family)
MPASASGPRRATGSGIACEGFGALLLSLRDRPPGSWQNPRAGLLCPVRVPVRAPTVRFTLVTNGLPMIIVTTPSLEGHRITRYLGLVSGEAILGANIFRDMFAGIRDIVGGRSAAYEQELRKAKAIALDEMQEDAQRLGGNAIVGVDLDYETITMGSGGGMLMVSASGTAVVIE